MNISVLTIISFLLLSSFASADTAVRVHPLYLEDTYRQDLVWKTLRDESGYLWLATSNGLRRYDGYGFKSFTHDPSDDKSLASDSVQALHQHSNGTLWVAGNTLQRYHPSNENFTRYPVSDYRFIFAIYESSDGALWFGGDNIGLRRFDPKTARVTHTFLANATGASSIHHIKQSSQASRIWLASDEGLISFDLDTHTSENLFAVPETAGPSPIFGIEEDDEGKVWLATESGLFVVDPITRSGRHIHAGDNGPMRLSTNTLSALAKDRYGHLWIGTDKHGVYRYEPEADEFQHFPASANDPYRFPLSRINHIHEDAEGTLWFASPSHGVYRLSPHLQKFTSFQHSFDSDDSLAFNNVLGMHEDRDGVISIATDGGGLDRFDPATYSFTHYRHKPDDSNSLSSDAVLDIAEDSQGMLWIGTWAGGLNRLNPKTGEITHILHDPGAHDDQTLASNNVFRVVVDKQDRLLIGVAGIGLQTYDPSSGAFRTFSVGGQSGIRNDYVNDILPTAEGDYWVAGYLGLEKFSPATGTFTSPALEVNEAVFDLHQDSGGLLWLATDHGLLRYNPKALELTRFTLKDGLSDEHIVGIEQDSLGYLWLASRNGLTRFSPFTKDVEVFESRDGLAGAQFNRLAHLNTRSGLMYVGTNNGFSFFNPLVIPRNEHAPKLHFTGLTINNIPHGAGESPYLEQSIDSVESLTLPSSTDRVQIGFSATNLISPSQNQYRYRLHGMHEDWLSVGSDVRSVQYNSLPPGDYILQVTASNNDGVWTGSTRDLKIKILPAWWQASWAYGTYLATLIAVIYGFSVLRLRLNDKHRRKLERLVNEQTTKLVTANRSIQQLNAELEQRVAQRTHDLFIEIEERKESESKVTYIAYHDALTGLHNRAWLLQHLEDLLRTAEVDRPYAILFIGGDRFRKINDTNGHQIGDKLLITTAHTLQTLCGGMAQVTRLGSDEFVIVIDRISSRERLVALADAIVAELKKPQVIDQLRLMFSVSVGVLIADKPYDDPAQVLRNASIAMQRAKERGRGLCQEFDEEILQQTLDLAALESDLKQALALQQFTVVYQPIILLNSTLPIGFEVLLRWHHPQRGPIPPDRFIPMAEASGAIFDIGLWVLEQACRQLQQWQLSLGTTDLPVIAVNLSPVQLERADFLERVDDILHATGVDTRHIEFEITESALLSHTDAVNGMLEALQERGIKLAIDDFGTGYSSLSYLDKLPVQVLKIDRSFVNALTEEKQKNDNASEIVRSTITLAHNLGMSVVAEGIETQQQLTMLQSYGCDYGQGYFFARPLLPGDATALLNTLHRQ